MEEDRTPFAISFTKLTLRLVLSSYILIIFLSTILGVVMIYVFLTSVPNKQFALIGASIILIGCCMVIRFLYHEVARVVDLIRKR